MPKPETNPIRYSEPVTALIRRRFSCRTYSDEPIGEGSRRRLEIALSASDSGPFGSPLRFRLVAADDRDRNALRGLGTYGFIRGATGFIVGAAGRDGKSLEEFGYRMEQLVLLATDLGLGTCWLGGTFTQSGFAAKIARRKDEIIPAVISVGRVRNPERAVNGAIRRLAGSMNRLPWEALFFQDDFSSPLSREAAGPFAEPLEMVRRGPSASNKQPWRILRKDGRWLFYLRRTPGYRGGIFQRLLRLADLQRIDMGIAMCHFELAAAESGLHGTWDFRTGSGKSPDPSAGFTAAWSNRTRSAGGN